MIVFCTLIFLSGLYPLWRAWIAIRPTSLTHALAWGLAAYLACGAALLACAAGLDSSVTAMRFVAVGLIGCAGVAVLGARRPGVGAWNFVVVGLLAVLLLFLAEGVAVGGELQLGVVRTVFLALTLAVGVLNYLPTRLTFAALLLGVGCGLELTMLATVKARSWQPADFPVVELSLVTVPWVAWLTTRRQAVRLTGVDFLWHDFRDRFGLVWGQRLREQFNRAAENAEVPVELGWSGLRSVSGTTPPTDSAEAASLGILQALMKRFGPETGS
ncbi:MAG: hypothetical protein K2R98_21320 [Gemmataceae bacterium]|nr:hypothetical protein [Gemmataceae bacterium]